MTEHTKTPWAVTEITRDGKYTIIDAPSQNDRAEPICMVEHDDVTGASRKEAYANAAFIVKAVNCHEELVAVLKLAREAILAVHHDKGGQLGTLLKIDDALKQFQEGGADV